MGVKGLWGMLRNASESEPPENKTLAIDISIWIHHFKDMQEKDIVYSISKRIIKLLFHKIKPVFIFDGTPNEMKKKVLLERKKQNYTKLINDIINNKTCKKCKKSTRTCRHGGILNDKIRNEMENQVQTNLKEHDGRWGEEHTNEEESTINCRPSSRKRETVIIDEALIHDIVNSNNLTKNQKLRILLKMREKRKEKLGYDSTSLTGFSTSQITNIKKRNLISFYIKRLEKEKSTRVQSDCFKQFVFTKEVKEQTFDKFDVEKRGKLILSKKDLLKIFFLAKKLP